MKVASLRRGFPYTPEPQQLVRYETNMEQVFEGILNQLERLQRMRKGQSVAPTLDVNLST
jgi:hypothetical protein